MACCCAPKDCRDCCDKLLPIPSITEMSIGLDFSFTAYSCNFRTSPANLSYAKTVIGRNSAGSVDFNVCRFYFDDSLLAENQGLCRVFGFVQVFVDNGVCFTRAQIQHDWLSPLGWPGAPGDPGRLCPDAAQNPNQCFQEFYFDYFSGSSLSGYTSGCGEGSTMAFSGGFGLRSGPMFVEGTAAGTLIVNPILP